MPTISAPRGLLEQLLAQTIMGRIGVHPYFAILARRHHVLPVFGDFIGFWVVGMDGRLAFVPDEDQDRVEQISDDTMEIRGTHVALAQAAIAYPELAPFILRRPPNAVACTRCDGHGQISKAHPNSGGAG
jgi:hypothetical protein